MQPIIFGQQRRQNFTQRCANRFPIGHFFFLHTGAKLRKNAVCRTDADIRADQQFFKFLKKRLVHVHKTFQQRVDLSHKRVLGLGKSGFQLIKKSHLYLLSQSKFTSSIFSASTLETPRSGIVTP